MTENRPSSEGVTFPLTVYFRRRIPAQSFAIVDEVALRVVEDPVGHRALHLFQIQKLAEIKAISLEWILAEGNPSPNYVTEHTKEKLIEAKKALSETSQKTQEALDLNPSWKASLRRLEEDFQRAYELGSLNLPDRVSRVAFMENIAAAFGMRMWDSRVGY